MLRSLSWAGIWTVLSATIMFADKPHRLNERTSAQRFCVLTILPPVPHSRLGYPRSGLSRSDFVRWHIASFRCAAEFDRYRGIADIGQAAPIKLKFMSRRPRHPTPRGRA